MYELTLTQDERSAFDWVGDRYNAGQVSSLLCECLKEDEEWGQEEDISFDIPEHIAWQIRDLAEEESYEWPCFAYELKHKLNVFCFEVV